MGTVIDDMSASHGKSYVMDVLTPPESAAKPGAIIRTSRKLFVELIGTFSSFGSTWLPS